ncbi:MAG: hypothetical protein ABIK77_01650 [candidate division WOR-3 bacterium]
MKRLFDISLFIFIISFVRLSESVIKKTVFLEINNRENELKELIFLKDSLEKELKETEQEISLQNLKRSLGELKEFFLEIDRKNKLAYLKIEDKTLRRMNFDLFLQGDFALPMGILQIVAKQETTYFTIPEHYYGLLGKRPPKEEERIIKNSFSPYLLSLGENLVICGPFAEELPKDLIDFNAIIFSLEDMKVLFHSLKENSKVVFY